MTKLAKPKPPRKTTERKPPALSEQKYQAFVWLTYAQTWIIKSLRAAPKQDKPGINQLAIDNQKMLDRLAPRHVQEAFDRLLPQAMKPTRDLIKRKVRR